MCLKSNFKHLGRHCFLEFFSSLKGEDCIVIGNSSRIQHGTTLTAWHDGKTTNTLIDIGSDCCIGAYNHITACNFIKIGDGCLIGKWVTITDNSHGQNSLAELDVSPQSREIFSKGPVVIGKNVWIGDKVTILPNVRIGDGSVIAANAVVVKDVPAYCVACGVPARVVKQYDKERN